jgi:hypothetical protein
VALRTESPYLCGVIQRETGKIIVVDLRTFKEVLNANVIHNRITASDVKELHQPWLLDDGEHFYVALNGRFDTGKLIGGMVSNNFGNGTRCIPVNGWFCAFDSKKGAFLWHGVSPYLNQMLVVEQFQTLPFLLFTSRYQELVANGAGVRTVVQLGSTYKDNGISIWWPDPTVSNGNAQFYAFNIDLKAGTVNLIGYQGTVQFYASENRPAPKKDQQLKTDK